MDQIEFPMPFWACGKATGYMEQGAMLPTRDGRKIGNATVLRIVDDFFADIVTDAGTMVRLTATELETLFHPPTWIKTPKSSQPQLGEEDIARKHGVVLVHLDPKMNWVDTGVVAVSFRTGTILRRGGEGWVKAQLSKNDIPMIKEV